MNPNNVPPVRKVVTRSGKGIRGKFPSRKLGRMVLWESPLEADAIRLFEFNVAVAAYYSQPSWEVYHDAEGQAHRFAPDFRVDFLSGESIFVEVKSDHDAAYKPNAFTLGLKAMAMQAQGKRYRVLTPSQIRTQPRFDNLKLLERCSRSALGEETKYRCHHLAPGTLYTVQDLARLVGGETVVFQAIAQGVLRTHLHLPLNSQSMVWNSIHWEAGDGSFSI